jgi:hypothetical protein
MHPLILKPINLVAQTAIHNNKFSLDLTALDKNLKFKITDDNILNLTAENLNLADYIDGPLPQNLKLSAKIEESIPDKPDFKLDSGSFQLGMRNFEIQPITHANPNPKLGEALITAISLDGGKEIRYELLAGSENNIDFSKPRLTCNPELSPEDTVAHIFFQNDYSQLSAADRAHIQKLVTWFSFNSKK